MIIQSAWKDTIINMKSKAITFIKMLCVTVGMIILLREAGMFQKKSNQTTSGETSIQDFAMGTSVSVQVYGSGDTVKCADDCMQIIKDVDEQLLSRRLESSQLHKLNKNLVNEDKVEISKELYQVLNKTKGISETSDGALDYTIRPIGELWNIEDVDIDSFVIPSTEQIDAALDKVGYKHVSYCEENNTYYVVSDQAGIEFELGAVGKGYVLDAVCAYLKQQADISGAVVHAGGSVLVYGSKEDKSTWKIGVRNPKGAIDDIIGYLEYPAGTTICVSTSGDYEKYIEKDGIRYHHIFDGRTGYPAESGLASVTVVCKDGLYSDALSTACFVLGYEKSLPVLKTFGAEAVFIDHENKVQCTDGLLDIYHAN